MKTNLKSKKIILFKLLNAAIIAAGMPACTLGPDFKQPAEPVVTAYTKEGLPSNASASSLAGVQGQQFKYNRDIPADWWTLFHSQELNELIKQALSKNTDLQAAEAALRAAQENVLAQKGSLYPNVTGEISSTREKDAVGTLSSNSATGASLYSLRTAQFSVSYMPDLLGSNRRQLESIQAQEDYQQFQLEAAHLSLISNLVVAVVQEASLRAQITSTEEVIRLENEALQLLQKQNQLGEIAESNVAAQETILAQLKATLPPLRKQLSQQRNLITALAGELPGNASLASFTLDDLTLPHDLPVTLPAKLIEQRPDIKSAEAQLHVACAQVGVAETARFPDVSITASAGASANEFNKLFSAGTGFWNVAGNIVQPIFSGGMLMHRQRAAEAYYEQANAQYKSVVISAFQNVADALNAIDIDAESLQAAIDAERSAGKSLEIAKQQLRVGDISYLGLLNAEQTYQQAVISLVQARAARFTDTAVLFQALGGGWWNREKSVAYNL